MPIRGKLPIFAGAGLFIFLLVVVAFWWFIPRADVAIFVSPQTLEGDEVIEVSSEQLSPDVSEMKMPGTLLKTKVDGEKIRAATGKKQVGEKATGTITLRNGTSSGVKLEVGTVLSSGGLDFVTTEEASVSAALSPSEPGEVTIDARASEIGADYNIGESESFSVSGFPKSELDAVSVSAFSGGSSRDIVAVSQGDVDSLEEDLTKDLKVKAQESMPQGGQDSLVIEDSITTEVVDKEFSQKVGDEASEVELSMSLDISALTVKKSDLEEFISQKLSSNVPEGFILRPEQVTYEFRLLDEGDGIWELELSYKANLLPSVDPDQVAKSVRGKHPLKAEEALKTIPGYQGAEVTVRPRLPLFFSNITFNTSRITVDVVAK